MGSANEQLRSLDKIENLLDGIMQVDASWCRHRIKYARRRLKNGKPANKTLQSLIDRCTRSHETSQGRKQRLPVPAYDASLPIVDRREDIIAAIRKHPVLIISGETGSGKTTQIPKMCLEAVRGVRGLIGCTQPRRIAARAMAERVSEELKSELGQLVGYQVRFQEKLGRHGIIKFMTDGILLAETTHDRDLDAYDTIIIDEAHERSLNIDFLLGYLKRLQTKRPDLCIIICSATIDTDKFSNHFNNAPVMEVSGRGYPVKVEYLPLEDQDEGPDSGNRSKSRDLYKAVANAVHRLSRVDRQGDILVFFSGEREINEAADFLGHQNFRHTEILRLYARLPVSDQRRVFHPGSERRIILCTNVAETSLTVPRIRFVIDTGLARISRYSHRSRVQRLPIEPVSQASANQRLGRCGRLGPGTCVRLYSEEDFSLRPEFTEPEILRTSLANVILRMLTMNLGAVEDFPFLDPPAPRMIKDAHHLLYELDAIDVSHQALELGRKLARWPLDVRMARMLIEGSTQGCLREVMVLVAALTIQDPRERPLEATSAADQAHGRFDDDKSDFLTLLKLWHYLQDQRGKLSAGKFRRLCRREYLNWQRVNEWFDLNRQLLVQAREEKLSIGSEPSNYAGIHKSLLAGLLSHVGNKNPEDSSYMGPRSRTFHIFPGSVLFVKRPAWLMSAQIVETSKTYARTNAAIEPAWLEEQAAHLLKHHYSDPHWSRRQGRVLAWEQVSLFGLIIVERRRVNFSRIDAQEARRIFITGALVRGELETRSGFLQNNQKIREEVEELEHKRRRHDVLADESALFEFFDARIPTDVCDSISFEKWLKTLGNRGRRQLYIGHDVLMREQAPGASRELYPDSIEIGMERFPLSYQFKPGHVADGVTLQVPLEKLNTLENGQLQWLVPGLLRDKVIALIKALPKPQRRALTPAPQFADAALEQMRDGYPAALLPALARALQSIAELDIQSDIFNEVHLEDYLRIRVQVVDGTGQQIAADRDLFQLQEKYGQQAKRRFMDRLGRDHQHDNEHDWVFGELPVSLLAPDRGGQSTRAYPAVVDQADAVGLRLFDTAHEASQEHYHGVLRLLDLQLTGKLRGFKKRHNLSVAGLTKWSTLGPADNLVDALAKHCLESLACSRLAGIRSEPAYRDLLRDVRGEYGSHFQQKAGHLDRVLHLWHKLSLMLDDDFHALRPGVYEDVHSQLDDMIYEDFVTDLSADRLQHYPRYLQAMLLRLENVEKDPGRDADRMGQVKPFWQQYLGLLEAGRDYDERVDRYRWMIEEFRVSLFAQQLGTPQKVSPQRLQQAWQEIR